METKNGGHRAPRVDRTQDLPAGRELDALVAGEAMGLRLELREPTFGVGPYHRVEGVLWPVPHYSAGIATAMLVLDKPGLFEAPTLSRFDNPQHPELMGWWEVWDANDIWGDEEPTNHYFPTLAHSICIAALGAARYLRDKLPD